MRSTKLVFVKNIQVVEFALTVVFKILEELNREKENKQPRASSDAIQLEMERIVDRLIASPLCL